MHVCVPRDSTVVLLLSLACLGAPTPATGQTFVNPSLAAPSRTGSVEFGRIDPAAYQAMIGGVPPGVISGAMANLYADSWTEHARYARDNFDEFVQAVETFRTDPARAEARANAADSAFVAANLAGVASRPIDAREALDAAPSVRGVVARAQDRLAAALDVANEVIEGLPIVIFATGTARETLDDDDAGDAGTPIGTGSLGAQIGLASSHVTAMLTVVGAEETMTDDFGAAVLSPMSGSSLASALLDYRKRQGFVLGFLPQHWYLSVSSYRWRPSAATEDVPTTIVGAAGLYHKTVIESRLLDNGISLGVEAGPTFRYIGGDADRSEAVSEEFGGLRSVYGLETGFTLTFGRVTAAAQMYIMEAGGIDGLHGVNLVAGLSVSGEFISGRLRR